MRPELRAAPVSYQALDAAGALLTQKAPQAEKWSISLPQRGGDNIVISWLSPEGNSHKTGRMTLDPESGRELVIRDTRGGDFLYTFHFQLYYFPWWIGRLLICVATLAMLVAILTGVITHKKVFTDFFQLRFGKGQRSWLDSHNITAVLALPFHLMITYTGLVTLLFTLMPWAISANFQSADAFYQAAYPPAPKIERSDRLAASLPLSELVARASAFHDDLVPRWIDITNPGDASAIIGILPGLDGLAAPRDTIFLSAITGEQIQPPITVGGARATQNAMIDLHAGRFSGPMLRWLYFLSGIGGTVMVATGLVLWTVKRRARLPDPARPHFGFRLVERLNIGVIAGAPAGIAVYFLANRLLPLDMANRAEWEINSLFIVWGGLFVWTLARPAKRAWMEALAACAALYALVPVVNALTTERGLISSLIARDWVYVGFDLVMLAMAATCTLTTWKVATYQSKATPRRKGGVAVEA